MTEVEILWSGQLCYPNLCQHSEHTSRVTKELTGTVSNFDPLTIALGRVSVREPFVYIHIVCVSVAGTKDFNGIFENVFWLNAKLKYSGNQLRHVLSFFDSFFIVSHSNSQIPSKTIPI